MALLADCFALLLYWRLVSGNAAETFKCPHEINRGFEGYILRGALKPCVTVIRRKDEKLLSSDFPSFFDVAVKVCNESLPGGIPFALNYLDLDEARLSYGRFKGAKEAVTSRIGNKGHVIFLGWKITKFDRGRRMVIVFGDGKTKIYRRTHPEIEDFIKRAEHRWYRSYYRKGDRLPVCGMYDMATKKITPIHCKQEFWKRHFHSFICQSYGYDTCHRKKLRTRCAYVGRDRCCPRTKYIILRKSQVPGETCDKEENACDQPCDTLPRAPKWKTKGSFGRNPGDVCGNVTLRRFWIPENFSDEWDCRERPCCVQELEEDLGRCPCQNVTCLHNGRCVNFNRTSFKCVCTERYTGPKCEEERIEEEEEQKVEAGMAFWQYSWPYLVGAMAAGMGTGVPFCAYLGYLKGTYDIKLKRALDNG
ncbi:hypothetical protein M514_12460 [Trichuris suis]|uniref:EGF-like domain-containing protein n=1 Tax=Trichuris suis TaxID=68888 RepID=A0A085LNV5_9BILA|nr:hypothetical protein M513_12460 [Trichuris suis]KFD64159.1 hypothetical protein M514_12460 [Trichuris suis]